MRVGLPTPGVSGYAGLARQVPIFTATSCHYRSLGVEHRRALLGCPCSILDFHRLRGEARVGSRSFVELRGKFARNGPCGFFVHGRQMTQSRISPGPTLSRTFPLRLCVRVRCPGVLSTCSRMLNPQAGLAGQCRYQTPCTEDHQGRGRMDRTLPERAGRISAVPPLTSSRLPTSESPRQAILVILLPSS
jgi:hypothetical protein